MAGGGPHVLDKVAVTGQRVWKVVSSGHCGSHWNVPPPEVRRTAVVWQPCSNRVHVLAGDRDTGDQINMVEIVACFRLCGPHIGARL